jgi:hypothetical protein
MIELFLLTIPLESADQQKLEALIRKIPQAFVKQSTQNGQTKKAYEFPSRNDLGFKILCDAIYYRQSELPSHSSCSFSMTQNLDPRLDEQTITIKDHSSAESLFLAMSYGQNIKTFYSNERVHGVNRNGQYQDHFRFSFRCERDRCQLNLSSRPADNN